MSAGATLRHVLPILTFVAACGEGGPGIADSTDGGGGGDAGPDAAVLDYDCANLPQGPFEMRPMPDAIASEDLAFDAEGNLVGNRADQPGIYKSPYEGEPRRFSATLSGLAGMRFLPNGALAVANWGQNALARIDPDGIEHVVLSGLTYPNGVAVDLQGLVYLVEYGAGRLRRVDPMTGDDEILLDAGTLANPNGVSFSPDYRTLYLDDYVEGGTHGRIWTLPIAEDGTVGKLTLFAEVGGFQLDGIAVDACGNVYVTELYGPVYRIRPDGSDARALFNDTDDFHYMPNMDFGSGLGGWDARSLYLVDGFNHGVIEVTIGVPSKPRPFP